MKNIPSLKYGEGSSKHTWKVNTTQEIITGLHLDSKTLEGYFIAASAFLEWKYTLNK